MNGDNIYTWLAVVAASIALGKQGYDAFKNRKKTRREIEEALDKQPQVREQLELGNWGLAIEHLNTIITQQADHISRQDDRIHEQDQEIEELRKRLYECEKSNRDWEDKYDELETKHDNLQADFIRLQNEVHGGNGPHDHK